MPNLLHAMPKLNRAQQSTLMSVINVYFKTSLRWDFKYGCCPTLGFYPKAKALEALDKWMKEDRWWSPDTEYGRYIDSIRKAINS